MGVLHDALYKWVLQEMVGQCQQGQRSRQAVKDLEAEGHFKAE